jgi:hypothetical protein
VKDRPFPDIPYGLLEPGEQIHAEAQANDGAIIVTDRRLAVAVKPGRFRLDVPFEALRRIQFDIERERPATLVIVPEHPSDEPVVLAIPPEQYESIARALAVVGRRLHDVATSVSETTSVERMPPQRDAS